jgi:hypothetical protein
VTVKTISDNVLPEVSHGPEPNRRAKIVAIPTRIKQPKKSH